MTERPISRAGILATIAAVLVVVAGLITLGKPSRARERRMDGLRVDDLTQLSSAVDAYWNKHQALPPVLDSLTADRQLDRVPSDPQTNAAYTYLVSGARSYRLCATFAQSSDSTDASPYPQRFGIVGHSWRHGAGESCFDLTPPQRDAK